MKLVRFAPALTLVAAVAVLGLTHCSGAATCDAVCDNVLDKCTDGFLGSSDAARNDCVEQCSQRAEAVPDGCAAERDDVLSCLAMAESIDCDDPQRSSACTDENEALAKCGSGDDGGQSTSSGPSGQPCDTDDECGTGLCNWNTKVCSTPAELGAACQRDEECASDLCNWNTTTCSSPAELGAACQRDEECASDLCNWNTTSCSEPAALGGACQRDEECASDLCNWSTTTCSNPGPPGAPCVRDEECASSACSSSMMCA